MTTPSHAITCLRAFFDATARLQDATTFHVDEPGVVRFNGDSTPAKGIVFHCKNLHLPSHHVALTIHPLIRNAEQAWRGFVEAAIACAPVLRAGALGCLQRPFERADNTHCSLHDLPLMLFVRASSITFSTPSACVHAFAAFLDTLDGTGIGDESFTIRQTLPPKGGCERHVSHTFEASDVDSAVRIWMAFQALQGHNDTIVSIQQTHDHDAVVARVMAQRQR